VASERNWGFVWPQKAFVSLREFFRNLPKKIQGEPLIHPLLLDVTKDKHVQQAHEAVERWIADANGKKKQRCLHALVKNASIGRLGLIDWTTLDDYEICMQVNCYGPIRMVKSFLPLLKKQVIDDTYHDS
jgi:NAD(P)-dependent dehydrogenase (short-subunit alcohol dehydrogenase family)